MSGGEITREGAMSSKKTLEQVFYDKGTERKIVWSVEIKGFAVPGYENLGTVAGVERLIPGKGVWGYALPHETPYGLKIESDCECNAEIFIDGMDASHRQGLFRIVPGKGAWIMRPQSEARAFTLLKLDSDEGRDASIGDDPYAGCVLVKIWPIVKEHTDEHWNAVLGLSRGGATRGGWSAAGTGLGEKVSQQFTTAEHKECVGESDCCHLQMSCVLMCKEKTKYAPVHKPVVSTREAFSL